MRVGDTILIERAGEVIPHVIKVIASKRKGKPPKIRPPKACPDCGGKVLKEEGLVAVACVNPSCPAQLKRGLLHFASRDAMDIEGMGDAVVEQLVGEGKTKTFTDVYRLKKDDLMKLELFADKRAENLLTSIAESKKQPLSRLIYALGIRHVGEKMARVLARKFGDLRALKDAGMDELSRTEDIGPVVAESIFEFFRQEEARKLVRELEQQGLRLDEPPAPPRRKAPRSRAKPRFHRRARDHDAVRRRGEGPRPRRRGRILGHEKTAYPSSSGRTPARRPRRPKSWEFPLSRSGNS